MKKFRWGIMGLGRIAESFAAAVISSGSELVCASRSYEKAAAFAERFNAVNSFGSYEELARDESIDAIYIATPMSCHLENAMLCIENGKNVLCEKSATINAAQWQRLCDLADKKGVFLCEAMWMKFLPPFLKAKEWVNSGRIGAVRTIYADFSVLNRYNPADRLFAKELGGGALLDLGVYPITFIHAILGKPLSIYSAMSKGPSGVDFSEAVIMKYDGAFGEARSSFDVSGDCKATIIGSDGSIAFDPWFFCSRGATLLRDGEEIESFRIEFPCNGYEYELYEAERCIAAGLKESPKNPWSDTLAVLEIMDKIRRDNGLSYADVSAE